MILARRSRSASASRATALHGLGNLDILDLHQPHLDPPDCGLASDLLPQPLVEVLQWAVRAASRSAAAHRSPRRSRPSPVEASGLRVRPRIDLPRGLPAVQRGCAGVLDRAGHGGELRRFASPPWRYNAHRRRIGAIGEDAHHEEAEDHDQGDRLNPTLPDHKRASIGLRGGGCCCHQELRSGDRTGSRCAVTWTRVLGSTVFSAARRTACAGTLRANPA